MDSEKKNEMTLRIIKDSLVFNYLPNPSDMIRNSPRGLKTFDDMLKDSRIVGLFYDRAQCNTEPDNECRGGTR